jgi:hypothetical protein
MDMSHNRLQVETGSVMSPAIVIPLATEADFERRKSGRRPTEVGFYQKIDSDSYAYLNAETCPDCGGGMIRQGRCCACPSCGFESCVM